MGLCSGVPLHGCEGGGVQPSHTEDGVLHSMENATDVCCQLMQEGGGVLQGLLVGSGSQGGARMSAASLCSRLLLC